MTYGAVGRAQNYAETAGTAALSFRGGTTICYRGGTRNRERPIVDHQPLYTTCNRCSRRSPPRMRCNRYTLSMLNAFTFDLTSRDTSSPTMKPGIEPRIDFSLFFDFQSSSLSFTKEYEGTGRAAITDNFAITLDAVNGLLCHESMKNMIWGGRSTRKE